MIMIGLRTTWGVNLEQLNSKFKDDILEVFQNDIKEKLDEGVLIIEDGYLKIPEKHWFMADGIASDLFQV